MTFIVAVFGFGATTVGSNVTLNVQLAPGATLVQLVPVGVGVAANCAPPPPSPLVVNVSVIFPVLTTVTA